MVCDIMRVKYFSESYFNMGYKIVHPWRGNPRVIELHYSGVVSSYDIKNALDEVSSFLNRTALPIHLIFNFQATQFDTNLLDNLRDHPLFTHPQLGYCMFLSPDSFINFTIQTWVQQIKLRVKYITSLDDAWEYFNELGLC